MTDPRAQLQAKQDELIRARRRFDAISGARASLLEYLRLTMPDPNDPEDVTKSRYVITPQARLLCQLMEKIDRREVLTKSGARNAAVSIGPQMGKALHVDTPIPTPTGWSRIDDLRPGDFVFDEAGTPTPVVAKTPVWKDRPVFRVTTDDGHEVIADVEHEWPVRLSKSYKRFLPRSCGVIASRDAKRKVKLLKGGALDLPEAELPVDPYVLGLWLGDGSSDMAYITAHNSDRPFYEAEFARRGYDTYALPSGADTFGVRAVFSELRKLGLINNKHIPNMYLRASARQRLDLLRGLVDSDGHIQVKGGSVEFCTIKERLARQVRELVNSFGVRCSLLECEARLYGRYISQRFRLHFRLPGAALLPRKFNACAKSLDRPERFLTVEPAGVGDTVCIEVASRSHMFLCGKGMIPTCNSQIISRAAPAWMSGRNPALNAILGSYNQDFANDFGDDVRALAISSAHQQVFPDYELRKGGQAKDQLITTAGGKLAFVGVGGSGTGKPADVFIVDDPIRNDDDAQSELYRDRIWNWFTKVASTRIHNDSAMVVVQTRWHEDDLIGRLCDPEHPERNKKYAGIADDWLYINLPAVVTDKRLADALGLTLEVQTDPFVVSQFGEKPMAALWPGKFSLPFLARQKRLDRRGFGALRMGRPAPEDGDYFRLEDIVEYYSPDDLPKHLRIYGASDHAVTEKRKNDATVIGCVGVDQNDDVWVLPDLVWDRIETDKIVEEMLIKFKDHRPELWWMESELISKSFGPFLMKRMQEEKVYIAIDPVTVATDKKARGRSIQGRMRMRKGNIPAFATWWGDAKNELLKFPFGTHDDFVDWLAHIGMGLLKEVGARAPASNDNVVRVGSVAWMLADSKRRAREAQEKKVQASW